MRPAATAGLALLAGCGGFEGPPVTDPDLGALFDTAGLPCADEIEPNDGGDDFVWLGLADGERAPSVCGAVERTGTHPDGTFAGDLDFYVVQGIGAGTLRAELDWTGDTDLYLFVNAGGDEWWSDRAPQERFALVEREVQEGFYTIEVAAASGEPTDYVLTLSR